MVSSEHIRRMNRRIQKDPFLKYFKPAATPPGYSGPIRGYVRRLPPPAPFGNLGRIDPGVTREAADIYRQKTGSAYGGALLPIDKDPTYAASSFGKADREKARKQRREFRRTASQKTLFGGNIRTLFPSLPRSLTRRRAAAVQLAKQKPILGK